MHNLVKNALWAQPPERREAALSELRRYLGSEAEVREEIMQEFCISLLRPSPEWKYLIVGLYRADAPALGVVETDPAKWIEPK